MTSLKAYLAEKYMSGPKAEAILSKVGPQKKKKRKAATATASSSASGARIVDEDGGWVEQPREEEAEDLEDVVVEKDRGFKKRKVDQKAMEASGGWAVVQESIEQEEEREQEDEKPVVVETFVGGLLAAKDLKKVLNRKPEKRQKGRSEGVSEEDIAQMQETVYRDASGRRIDTKAERAEAARLKREREEQEAKKMEWGKGLVQKDEEEKRKREIEKQKATAFARRADDKELNQDLMAKELWNDPAAAFLTVSKL